MFSIPNFDNKSQGLAAQDASLSNNAYPTYNQGDTTLKTMGAFENYLGSDGYDQFMRMIGRMVTHEFSKADKKLKKAAKNLRNSLEGKPHEA
ncbi:MAG: hypothetical protein K9M07_00040 [Simkaniaceae bacterium]|nr:hypothetical protein [Simkaniaceae bacterium]